MSTILQFVYFVANVATVALQLLRLFARPRSSLIAENLFLRKQLAFYQERQARPRRLNNSARFTLAILSRFFEWRASLVIGKPDTLIRWHRKRFKIFWNRKSRLGRPPLPKDLQRLIAEMVRNNATWSQLRIADELSLKLGILVSPRTVRAYWPRTLHPSRRTSSVNWQAFVRNHAKAIVACDFLVAVTARFRILYVFLVMEIGSRRIIHFNVTSHPTAAWCLQQFREAIPSQHTYPLVLHDRDATFSAELDQAVQT